MIQFTYSFCMAMLHSFWQAALLLALYIIADRFTHKKNSPLAKRNFLYIAIMAQLSLFACTFSVYFFDTAGFGTLAGTVKSVSDALGGNVVKLVTPWLFSIYLFIIAIKLIAAVYNWHRFKIQYRSGLQKPAVELKLFTELKAYQFGIKRKVKLWLSNSVQTPVTFGYFKPVILLPVALLNNITTKQAETLILHELTHIRTHDYLLNWFLVTAETIFFFNPFVTSLCKKIKLEREKNCDVNVLSFQYSPTMYAETLLLAERMKKLTPVFQLAAVNHKKHLLQRIQFFTSEKVINQTLRFNIVAPVIGLILLFMLSTAVLFQSQNTSSELQYAAGLHYMPADNYMLPNTELSSPVLNNKIVTEPIVDAPITEQTAIPQKKQTERSPVPQQQDEVVESKLVNDISFARPVTLTENDAARQIIIKEEGSGSASVKVYYLSFVDGKWVLEPEWNITAKEIMTADSLSTGNDSLKIKVKKVYPAQQ